MDENQSDEFGTGYAFGPFQLIPERQLLLRHGSPVRIGNRALDLLTALVQRPGELVSKRELMEYAWPNSLVVDDNLKVNMVSLRRALGELARSIDLAQKSGASSWQLRSSNDLTRLWLAKGRHRAASDLLRGVYGHFTEGHETGDLRASRDILQSLN